MQIPSVGQRVECVGMFDDPDPIPQGTQGTVTGVTFMQMSPVYHIIQVKWDDGRTLALLSYSDKWEIVK